MSGQCVFCDIVHGTSPASWVYQDDTVVAFLDIQPITQGHMLVVPREHAELMTEINETAAMRTFRVARRLAEAARRVRADVPRLVRAPARSSSARRDRQRDPRRGDARYGVMVTFRE